MRWPGLPCPKNKPADIAASPVAILPPKKAATKKTKFSELAKRDSRALRERPTVLKP